jgi:hypothetical protein
MDYPVEKSPKLASTQALAGQRNGAAKQAKPLEPLYIRNEHGQFMPGSCPNPMGPKGKKPITAVLESFIRSPEGVKALFKAARSQVRVSEYQSSMAQYIRETLEGRLTERLEVSGGLELAARIRRARQRLAEADNNEVYSGENE